MICFFLAVLLVLQVSVFPAVTYAYDESEQPNAAESPTVTETVYDAPDEASSVTEAVYAAPFAFTVMTADPKDKTAVLVNANPTFHLTVEQGDPAAVIPVEGEINGRDNFTLQLDNIAVPTKGDDLDAPPESVIQQGDYAILDKATYFPDVNLTPTEPMSVKQGTLQIATIEFFEDRIEILFDGTGVYDGSKNSVKIGFSAFAKAENQEPGYAGNTTIFGYDYAFKNSDLVPEYTITLTSSSNSSSGSGINDSSFQEGTITWQAVITATDADDVSIPMPLDGLTFYNELADVGVYVPGSFTVDGTATAPVYGTDRILTYKFPEASTEENIISTATITFKTWIPKSNYYREKNGNFNQYGWTYIVNDVKLHDDIAGEDKASSNSHEVAIRPNWIAVSGKPSKSGDDMFITWTVAVNSRINNNRVLSRDGLLNAKITDILPDGLEWVSATYKLGESGSESSIVRNGDGEYDFGLASLDDPLYLTVTTKITDSDKSTFTYKARANWDLAVMDGIEAIQNNDAIGWAAPEAVVDDAVVTIGAHTFTKKAATSTELHSIAGTKWTINLKLQYDLDAPIVYDLLVHGDSFDVLDQVDGNPKVTTETLNAIKNQIDNKQLWQKYRKDSLTVNSGGVTAEVIPLTVDGAPVADLIKVTGFQGEVAGNVSFETVTTNPDNLFRQDNAANTWGNRSLLFDGDTYVSYAQANTSNFVRMLNKEMLYANTVDVEGIAADWNRNYTGQWQSSIWKRAAEINDPNWYVDNSLDDNYILAGYDRKDKTVTFRLAVNMPGFNTEEMSQDGGTRVASDITLVDTLPEGWEFVDFAPGETYRLYKGVTGYRTDGKGGNGKYTKADSVIEPDTPEHVVNFTKDGNVGTFTFSKLESPYVILVKARPTNATLASYEIGNNEAGENQATFSMKWGDQVYSATENLRIIVPVQALSKTGQKPVSGVQEWTVNYTPPFALTQGVYLLDTLEEGLQLRKNADGGLSLIPSDIAVYRGVLQADGTLERDGGPLDLTDPNGEVKVTLGTDMVTGGETLRFDFTDPNNFYQIVYQTESQGMNQGTAGNSIKLMGDDSVPPIEAQSSVTLTANDVSGSANENGLLFLKKVAPDGTTPLKDVKFQLFNPDDTPARDKDDNVMSDKITDTNGETNFIIQVPGNYLLKQTYIDPFTYLPTTTVYRVRVIDAPGKPVLVDGQKVDSSNPLIVPTPAQGSLTITNTVTGNGSDPNKVFEYTVTFSGEGDDGAYTYRKSDLTSGNIKSGDKITLKHGESVSLPALPVDLVYTVTEDDYTTVDGYTTEPELREWSDTIEDKGDHQAHFVNERIVSNLTISNTVMGNGGEKTKEFEYTISFAGAGKDDGYDYAKSDGSSGSIQSGDTFRLKDGETLDILALPKNLNYTVTQMDYTADEYVTTPKDWDYTGIMEGNDEVAPFQNVRVLTGSLYITNTVQGNGGDPNKGFAYTVTFSGEGANETYSYTKSDGSQGTMTSGGSFELKHGESFLIEELPTYLQYTVIETDYTDDGYETDPASLVHTGTIPAKSAAEAHFINTRQLPVLEGVLRNRNTGEVIPNASIIVTNLKTGKKQTIQTNEKGEYSVIAESDTDYSITYTRLYHVDGKDVPIEFTQKANVDSSVTDETVPADNTAVGIVFLKQPEGQTSLLSSEFSGKMRIYLRDASGEYVKDESGAPKAFSLNPNGTFAVDGLSAESYHMEVRYEVAPGQELTILQTELDVKDNGELNVSQELVDPYGIITDELTGLVIEGAKVTLYYADTERNKNKGIVPGTKVTLPAIPGFAPNDNASPSQNSDDNGAYAYMVYPDTDYYLIVTKSGYKSHLSPTISVGSEIVRYDLELTPISSSGGRKTDSTPVKPDPDPVPELVAPEPTNPDPEQMDSEPADPNLESVDPEPTNPEPEPMDPEPANADAEPVNPEPALPVQPIIGNSELDDVPKTGDMSRSPFFYMVLALISLVTIGICLLSDRKKEHVH